jgi:hypothetical protein
LRTNSISASSTATGKRSPSSPKYGPRPLPATRAQELQPLLTLSERSHSRSASEPMPPPSPSFTDCSGMTSPIDMVEVRHNNLQKLRRHLSQSVPAELVLNASGTSASRRRSSKPLPALPIRYPIPPVPPIPQSLQIQPIKVDQRKLDKLRRHLSNSVPEHLVLSSPPRRTSTVELEEEDDCSDIGSDDIFDFEHIPRNPSASSIASDISALEFNQYETPVDSRPSSRMAGELFVNVTIDVDLPSSVIDICPTSPAPSTASSFRPVRLERGWRKCKTSREDAVRALRNLRP